MMIEFTNILAIALLALSNFECLAARSSSPTGYGSPKTASSHKRVASTWFAGWHGYEGGFTPEDISYNKYTNIVYAFVIPQEDVSKTAVNATDAPLLRKVVKYAHEVGTTVTVSVGGWTGSQFWSGAVSNSTNRQALVKALLDIVKEYDLDGLDFDWEYPNNPGVGCNQNSTSDVAHFLQFLRDMRESDLPKNKILSAATSLLPWLGRDGNPSTNVAEFAKHLDYIEIMNYDVYGPWADTAGPNSPITDACVKNSTQALGSAAQAVKAWNAAGFPSDQIVLGVPTYGHSYNVTPSHAYQHYKRNGKTYLSSALVGSYPTWSDGQPAGDMWDQTPFIDQCGVQEGQGGLFNYWGLIKENFLRPNGGIPLGISYYYDTCSQTPSVYNKKTNVWVEYDNPRSFEAKGEWIKKSGLRGFALWEAAGDYKDNLLDAIRGGTGLGCPTRKNPTRGGEHYVGPSKLE